MPSIGSPTGGCARAPRAPGRLTLREHALRMTAQPLWLYLALDVVLGPDVDRPIDRWAEMFLPGSWRAGWPARPEPVVPLVGDREVLFQRDRAAAAGGAAGARDVAFFARRGWAWGCCSSRSAGLRTAVAGGARRRSALLVALWGLVVGFIGCFLIYAWVFTDHVVAHRNQNILLCAPWAIVLVGAGHRRRDRARRARRARRSGWRRRRWRPRWSPAVAQGRDRRAPGRTAR